MSALRSSPQRLSDDLLLVDRVSTGGMADLYLAIKNLPDGGEELVAVKRIVPQFSSKADFRNTFEREVATIGKIEHKNIARILGNGEQQGFLYLVMEFVNGKSLEQILHRVKELRQQIPPEVAFFIASEIAAGLHFAHTLREASTGLSINLVHQDLSPRSIMVSFEGHVKLVDFITSRAADRSRCSKVRQLKSKIAYASPEVVEGRTPDARADVFSLGAIVYELLTREALFEGPSVFATIERVKSADVPPLRFHGGKVDVEIEAIVMRMLARDSSARYQTASQVQQDILSLLRSKFPKFTSYSMREYMTHLFPQESKEKLKKFRKLQVDSNSSQLSLASDVLEVAYHKDFTDPDSAETTVIRMPLKRNKSAAFRLPIDHCRALFKGKLRLDLKNTIFLLLIFMIVVSSALILIGRGRALENSPQVQGLSSQDKVK